MKPYLLADSFLCVNRQKHVEVVLEINTVYMRTFENTREKECGKYQLIKWNETIKGVNGQTGSSLTTSSAHSFTLDTHTIVDVCRYCVAHTTLDSNITAIHVKRFNRMSTRTLFPPKDNVLLRIHVCRIHSYCYMSRNAFAFAFAWI